MSQAPRISIVTPSYNQSQFLAETIESVISQEGEFEVEYFVMDGGSTDGSVSVIRHYAERIMTGVWPMRCNKVAFRWVSQQDKGQSDAINQGLRQATGDIVSYINSDDCYAIGAFARVIAEFKARPGVDFVYGDGDVIDEQGQLQWEWLSRPYDYGVLTSYHFLWNDFTNYILQQATFWRRSVLDQIGYFDETFHYAMDLEYWVRAGGAGLRFRHVPHKLGQFRLIPGTKSLSSPTAFWQDQLEIYRRHRGAARMSIFFAYYYYNLARECNYDWAKAYQIGQRVFLRWQGLPRADQLALTRQSDLGFALARLLLANELCSIQQAAKAAAAFESSLSRHPSLIVNPLALAYLAKRLAGFRLIPLLDTWWVQLIRLYRNLRYDYRYLQKID